MFHQKKSSPFGIEQSNMLGTQAQTNLKDHFGNNAPRRGKLGQFYFTVLFISVTDITRLGEWIKIALFFICYLAAPRPTLDHYRGDCFIDPV